MGAPATHDLQEPPLPPPGNSAPYACFNCGATIIGQLPQCPNCGVPLLVTASAFYAPPSLALPAPAPPAEFSYLKAVGAATLVIMAVLNGLAGVFFALLLCFYRMAGDSHAYVLGQIATICFLLMFGCIVGVAVIFRKRSGSHRSH